MVSHIYRWKHIIESVEKIHKVKTLKFKEKQRSDKPKLLTKCVVCDDKKQDLSEKMKQVGY